MVNWPRPGNLDKVRQNSAALKAQNSTADLVNSMTDPRLEKEKKRILDSYKDYLINFAKENWNIEGKIPGINSIYIFFKENIQTELFKKGNFSTIGALVDLLWLNNFAKMLIEVRDELRKMNLSQNFIKKYKERIKSNLKVAGIIEENRVNELIDITNKEEV